MDSDSRSVDLCNLRSLPVEELRRLEAELRAQTRDGTKPSDVIEYQIFGPLRRVVAELEERRRSLTVASSDGKKVAD